MPNCVLDFGAAQQVLCGAEIAGRLKALLAATAIGANDQNRTFKLAVAA